MKTQPNIRKIRVQVITAARKPAEDPEALWLDQGIEPEEFIARDPLDITPEMVDEAEQPELADYGLYSLPPRKTSPRSEAIAHKRMQAELRAIHGEPETAADFIARLRGST